MDRTTFDLVRLLVWVILLITIAVRGILKFVRNRGHDHWPLVTAKIWKFHTEIRTIEGSRVELHFVDYSYEVDGKFYQGSFEALEPWSSRYTLLTPVEVMYPVGSEIQVHVKPSSPSTSVPIVPEPQGMPRAL